VFLTAVIFTFLLQPAQQFLVGALDRIFFRNRYHQWEKMASLGVLAAGVAHELNTPLGVVLSSADQLVEDQDSGRAHPVRSKRLAQLCLGGAKRAADIVQNLRAFSRPESQDLQLVDVHDLIDGTLSLLGPRLESQGISVKQRRGAILPLEGYPVLLNQTLTNLILNAANAAGDNGEIRITTEFRDHDTVAVIVEDDGPGIPEELSGRIYEPFFTTRPPGEGSGLGLSLCYTIVDQHGGKIWEEGEPGEGARFVVELPLRASDQLRRRSLSGEPSR
ncbi:MAG: HAMP domain-containing sensor histidine kinase, partial [Myxococcota bacterium]|nr:HAMP domain-containing sensor histidine kinase [Myxococcota bacterium]